MGTTPMFSPDGTLGDIPNARVADAVKAGFKLGVDLSAPDGTKGTVPVDRVHDAMKSGFSPFVPNEAQALAKPPLAPQNANMKTAIAPRLVRTATGSLPAVGGTVGALLSSPGVVTSALGGGLGTAAGVEVKQLADRAIFGNSEPATTSKQGLKEAGTQAAIATGTGLVMGAVANAPSYARAWSDARAAKALDQSAEDFVNAIPPSKSAPYTPEDYQVARRYIEQEHPTGAGNGGTVESARDAADAAIGKIEDKVSNYIGIVPNDKVANNPIKEVVQGLSSNPRGQEFVEAGLKELQPFNLKDPTLPEADAIRRQLNAENKAVLKRNGYDIATARAADPGFAARELAAEALRNGEYDQLAARGIGGEGDMENPSIAEMRQDEGSLIRVRNAIQNQSLNGDKSVRAQLGVVRQVASGVVKAGATMAGAAVGGPPGAAVGQVAGEQASNIISPNALTRDALVERSLNVPAANAPVYPKVNLRIPPPQPVPSGTQFQLQPQPPGPPTTEATSQPGLFNMPPPAPAIRQSVQAEMNYVRQQARPWINILDDPSSTAVQKSMARTQLLKIPGASLLQELHGKQWIPLSEINR